MSPRRRRHVSRLFALISALGCAAAAREFDASLALTLGAGPPRALCAGAGLDARSSGLSPTALPSQATLGYRLKLAAPIPFAPAADDNGRLVVAHGAGKLTQLDTGGRPEWSLRVGPDAPATGPVIGNDGLRWLVTLGGEVAAVGSEGRLRFRKSLTGFGSLDGAVAAPLSTGGLALASSNRLAVLDREGSVLWLARSDGPARAVLEHAGRLTFVMTSGRVLSRGAEGQPTELADLGGRVDAAALLPAGDAIVAIVAQREIVSLELDTAKRRVLLSDPSLTLSGALAVGERGELRVLAHGGLLLGLSRQGQEAFRAPLPSGPLGFAHQPMPLIDAQGNSAVTLPDAGLTLVGPRGELELVSGSACPDPLRPTPTASRTLVLSCRSGLVFAVSGKAP